MRRPALIVLLVLGLVGACGGGGSDPDPDAAAPADAMPDAGPPPVDDLGLVAGAPLPSGQHVLVNEWSFPDRVFALDPADLGGTATTVFEVNRSWSMGARRDGSLIAFASADPNQEAHFGLTLGDAIQNSFGYTPATGTATMLAPAGTPWTNVNDECHHLTADGQYVYVCRRYDFVDQPAISFQGWRIGRIALADGRFEFLRPEVADGPYELGPQPVPGTDDVLFELVARPPATGRTLWTRNLVTGAETQVRASASRPVLSPDGHTVLYLDAGDQYRLHTFDLAAPAAPSIAVSPTTDIGAAAWSPDAQTIVYTVYDDTNICDHIERVTWLGAAWSLPARERDCTQTGEFIVDLAWITVP